MPRSSQQTILLVEDYKDSREMFKCLLEDLNYRVLAVANGKDALRVASEEEPDLILTDFNLPDMNGTEVIRRLRKLGERLSRMPIIMLTAYGRDQVYDLAMEAGCSVFLSKPIDFAVLEKSISKLLEESKEINGSLNGISH